MMELTITNVKEVVYNTLGQDLINAGFTFSKSYFEFKKKIKNNKVLVDFQFYDYKPSWIDYNFTFSFTIADIEKEAKLYHEYCGFRFNGYSMLLFEGDFHPPVKDKEAKYRLDYCHRISDLDKNLPEIEYSRKLLNEEFLTRMPIYTDLHLFQEYFLSDYEAIGTNGHTLYSDVLIAAKLKGMDELEKLVPYVWEKLELQSKPDNDFMKQFVSKIIPYARLSKNN